MNTDFWSKAPLVRLLLPFMAGVLVCAYYSGISINIYFFLAVISFLSYIISILIQKKIQSSIRTVLFGLLMSAFCFFAGATLCQYNKINLHKNFFANYLNDSSLVLIRIYEPLQEKENSYKAIAEVKAVINRQIIPAKGKLVLYLKKENLTLIPKYGDLIIIPNTIKPLQKPLNPEVFDYAEYMSYKKIYHSAYLQAKQILFTGQSEQSFFWQPIYALKQKLLATIDYYITGPGERGIAKALILGDDTEVLPQITASYAGTGTLHVLSVSGLHVGIIFAVLNFLLRSLTHTKTGRFTRVIILLLSLGFYGVLTGLSASVLRSVIMFSFLVVGMNYRKLGNIYNSMAFSALALLLYDPFLLMQLGFQLSYIALFGIVWLHPHISKFWQPEHKRLIWVRDILAMSVAAQLATFPLGLFYFNQFPSYFLLSNLLVIPWSSVVLFAGCIFLVISLLPIPEVFISFAGKIVYWSIHILNYIVEKLSALPFSQWEGTYISIFGCILIYLALSLIIFAFIYNRKKLLLSGLAAFVIFFCYRSFIHIRNIDENRLIVHAIPKTSLISIKEKNRLYLLGDSAFINNADQRKFYINRYAFKYFVPKPYITSPENASEFSTGRFYFNAPFGQVGKHNFLWLKNKREINSLLAKQKYDFIILSKNIKLRIGEIKEKIEFRKVILTADNSFFRNNNWETECKRLGISCTNLQKDNSFAITY